MKRTFIADSIETGRVCNEEEDLSFQRSTNTYQVCEMNGLNEITSTPCPQLKKRKIQKPSPTKASEDLIRLQEDYTNEAGYLDLLKRTEKNAIVHLDMTKQLYVTSAMRAILVDWMAELCYNYSLHRATYYLAVNILDRYLSLKFDIKKSEFQTVGAVCVIIATKYYEPVSISLDMIIQSTGNSCSKSQLILIEHDIINKLEWHLIAGTMANWVLFFLDCLRKQNTSLPFDLYYRCMDLCDRLILDDHYCQFTPQELSLAVVSSFSCENVLLRISLIVDDYELEKQLKVLLEEYSLCQDCVKWVLDIGLSAPSHPLLQLLDSPEGEKTKIVIQSKKEMFKEFNFIQPYNQFSLTHYSSMSTK